MPTATMQSPCATLVLHHHGGSTPVVVGRRKIGRKEEEQDANFTRNRFKLYGHSCLFTVQNGMHVENYRRIVAPYITKV